MVAVVTGLGRTGLQEWVIQRVTAMLLVIYSGLILYFFLVNNNITFEIWSFFLSQPFIKIATLLAISSLIAHTWVGLWTILTDYIKHFYTRLFIQMLINLSLLWYLVISVEILWGLK